MNPELDQQLIKAALSTMAGQTDALAAAVLGILELSRNIPELSMAIKENLATQYADRLVDSEDPQYIQAFEDTRAKILRILR